MSKQAIATLAAIFLFAVCYAVVTPEYIGDTVRYSADTVGWAKGRDTQFWEFGHLLWRPWIFVGHKLLGGWYARQFGDTPVQAAVRFQIWTSLGCSLLAIVIMASLLRKVSPPWTAAGVTFAMTGTVSFLNYSHSGAPYIPSMLLVAAGVWRVVSAVERGRTGIKDAAWGGLLFALACAFWFPNAFTGLGFLALIGLWPSKEQASAGWRVQLGKAFLGALMAVTLVLFSAGAAAKGVSSMASFRKWVSESDNGWRQTSTLMRAVTGVPRGWWGFGGDTIAMKRKLFRDPYNPSPGLLWALRLGAKLALFYGALALVIWGLRKPEDWPLPLSLAAAAVPVLLFAVLLFEPSGPERFLPTFPFLYLCIAAVVAKARPRVAAAGLVVALGAVVVVNLVENVSALSGERLERVRRRNQTLQKTVRPGALVFVATFSDDLYRLPATLPLDKSLLWTTYQVTDVIEVASERVARWRPEFVEQARQHWAAGKEVWISERLLATRPRADWSWVEGDDPRIPWRHLPDAFGALVFDAKVLEGQDGFLRLSPKEENLARVLEAGRASVR